MEPRGRTRIRRNLGAASAAALACAAAAAVMAPAGRVQAWPGVILRLRGAAPLARGPITYFNTACAACHGDYGSFYGEGFAADLADADLARVVREMVEGPARDSLAARDLAALTAYHRSLADGAPFLAWTVAPGGGELSGEVTPGAAVTVVLESGAALAAEVRGHAWRAPAGDSAWAEIRARRGGRGTVVRRGGAAFSHDGPAAGAGG